MKRILITGGAGFLGSHLCDWLFEKGKDIFCLDNYITGNIKNIIHFLGSYHFELIRHGIIIAVLTEWDIYRNLDYQKIFRQLPNLPPFSMAAIFSTIGSALRLASTFSLSANQPLPIF